MRDAGCGDVRGPEDAVGSTLPGGRGDVEAGVAGEGQFDGGAGEGAADGLRGRVADDEPEQRARGLLGVGVLAVGAGQFPTDVRGAGVGGGEGVLDLVADEPGLGLDVEAGEDEHDLVAEAAEAVEADLEGGGGASPVTPWIRTRSGPSWVSRTVSRRAVTSGPG